MLLNFFYIIFFFFFGIAVKPQVFQNNKFFIQFFQLDIKNFERKIKIKLIQNEI